MTLQQTDVLVFHIAAGYHIFLALIYHEKHAPKVYWITVIRTNSYIVTALC